VTERRLFLERRGFVMLTILWIITIAAIVATSAALVGRHAVQEGAARVALERGRWEALGCERRVVAAIDVALGSALTLDDAAKLWRMLPSAVLGSPLVAGCDVALEAAGTRLNVNEASDEMIVNLLDAIGLEADAPQLVDALDDWIDPDDETRPMGAERGWYEAAGRIVPRNGPLADVREMVRIRAFEAIGGLDSVFATEPGRVSLPTAPVSVLMAVPGITRETAEQIVELQRLGTPLGDLREVLGSVSRASAAALESRYADAARATTPDPDAWVVRVRVAHGTPPVAVKLEWRLIRTGRRCLVVATRSAI
jgi:general secretion pathway protein K